MSNAWNVTPDPLDPEHLRLWSRGVWERRVVAQYREQWSFWSEPGMSPPDDSVEPGAIAAAGDSMAVARETLAGLQAELESLASVFLPPGTTYAGQQNGAISLPGYTWQGLAAAAGLPAANVGAGHGWTRTLSAIIPHELVNSPSGSPAAGDGRPVIADADFTAADPRSRSYRGTGGLIAWADGDLARHAASGLVYERFEGDGEWRLVDLPRSRQPRVLTMIVGELQAGDHYGDAPPAHVQTLDHLSRTPYEEIRAVARQLTRTPHGLAGRRSPSGEANGGFSIGNTSHAPDAGRGPTRFESIQQAIDDATGLFAAKSSNSSTIGSWYDHRGYVYSSSSPDDPYLTYAYAFGAFNTFVYEPADQDAHPHVAALQRTLDAFNAGHYPYQQFSAADVHEATYDAAGTPFGVEGRLYAIGSGAFDGSDEVTLGSVGDLGFPGFPAAQDVDGRVGRGVRWGDAYLIAEWQYESEGGGLEGGGGQGGL